MASAAEIGLIGLAVMGKNLALNIADHGFKVAVFNRTKSKLDEFLEHEAVGKEIAGAASLPEFVGLLSRPRRIILMVKAGSAVDELINELTPLLESGDIVIDAGNSHFPDSERRVREMEAKGFLFVASGVSGGEEGARFGPSLMPGGSVRAWPAIKDVFQAIAAKVEGDIPCCDWVGTGGAGHYVKMVHNGIEYGDMQLIAETYDLMRRGLKLDNSYMAEVFRRWNKGDLDSYLVEITADILGKKEATGIHVVDTILDAAGQKGTGRWTVDAALDESMPLTLITEAVFARNLSALFDERQAAARLIGASTTPISLPSGDYVEHLGRALLCAKIVSYAQGFMLMRRASHRYNWSLDLGRIALLWRGGCIIRSRFLGDIHAAFQRSPDLASLLIDSHFLELMKRGLDSWRIVVAEAVRSGIAVPALSAGLSFFDSYRSNSLPANLIQAQRDYFGAHTYERIDASRGKSFHSLWNGPKEKPVDYLEV